MDGVQQAGEEEATQGQRNILDYSPATDPTLRRQKTRLVLMYIAHLAIGITGLAPIFIIGLLYWCGYRVTGVSEWAVIGCGAALFVLSLRLGVAVERLKRSIAELSAPSTPQ